MASPEPPLYYQGVSRGSAAFRILKQMGWEEGEGLGKAKQGITQHIRVINKKDNSGIGVDAQQKAAYNWTFNTVAFDNILKNLNVIAAVDTKEEDGTFVIYEKNEQEKKVHAKKLTRPQGRYKSREAGKIIQGKSQADIDAILGYTSNPSVFGTESKRSSNTVDSSQKQQREEETYVQASDHAMTVNVMTVNTPDWWGHKHGFVRAGGLGQMISHTAKIQDTKEGLEVVQSNCRTSFCEQDQEDLYNLVQEKATKGRQGLGIADRPKKIGGAHWKGQKVLLGSDTDEEEDLEDNNNNAVAGKGHGYHAIKDMKRNQNDYSASDDGKRKAANMVHHIEADGMRKVRKLNGDKVKWRKLCKQILREAPVKAMSIKRLHKLIVENCDLYVGFDADDHEGMVRLLKQKINASSKFMLQGKKVSLANID